MAKNTDLQNRSTNIGIYHYQIAAYALLKHLFVPKYKQTDQLKNAMIFFSAHIGDVVMFLDTLKRYQIYYSKKNGYRLVFACRKEVWAFLESLGFTGDMEFIEVNRDEILRSYPTFKKAVRNASKYRYEVYINPRTVSIIEHVFEYCLCAKEKNIVKIAGDHSKNSWQSRVFKDGQHYEAITVDRSVMLLRRFGMLADKLTGTHEPVHISRLPQSKELLSVPDRYFVVAPSTAETPSKCWMVENYVKLIDELVEKYNVDICLSGGKNDRPICQMVLNRVKHSNRVHDYVGKTDFQEWISLIARAEMVVCNDSSPMHIAASVGTKCVCIGGQWEGNCYYPYDVDEFTGSVCLPEVVLGTKLPCFYCTTSPKGRKGNPECKKAIDSLGAYPCINNVEYDDVIGAISHMLIHS